MKKKFKLILLAFLVSLASVCLFAGCNLKATLESEKKDNNVSAQITYFSNGGSFENLRFIKDIYYGEGARPLDIGNTMGGTDVKNIKITSTGYVLTGWYKVALSANGKPLYFDGSEYNENDEITAETRFAIDEDAKYEFKDKLKADDHIYLCAKWEKEICVDVLLGGNENFQINNG